jgi:integrase
MDQLFLQPNDFAMFLESQPEEEQDKGTARLLGELNKISNLNTRACYLTKYRNAVSKRLSATAAAVALPKLRFPKKFWDERKGVRTDVLDDKLRNVRLLDDIEGMTKIADQLLDSRNVHDLMIGLAFATGRRCIEVAKGAIEPTDQPNSVLFSGQVKTKNKKDTNPYIIPILLPVDRVLAAWAKVRTLKPLWAKSSNRDVTNSICLIVNRKTKKYFGLFGLFQFKDLRAVYACICYEKFAKNTTLSETKYYSTILGHSFNDNFTGLFYAKFKIISK